MEYSLRLTVVCAKTYTDGTFAKARPDQPPKLLVWAVEADSTLRRAVKKDVASVRLVRIVDCGSLHPCRVGAEYATWS